MLDIIKKLIATGKGKILGMGGKVLTPEELGNFFKNVYIFY